ncbi:hypothetical protein AVEN_168929-1 [Araneus ventricosus]|uniref:Uncharacterized protein n=1 Tax=Araneus ventricosus TaxID=182803 RepID=A0A4Y2NZ96_ARAVE|nr:hypothetical protein AVEN_168929-1 [Araneus ventricosus]
MKQSDLKRGIKQETDDEKEENVLLIEESEDENFGCFKQGMEAAEIEEVIYLESSMADFSTNMFVLIDNVGGTRMKAHYSYVCLIWIWQVSEGRIVILLRLLSNLSDLNQIRSMRSFAFITLNTKSGRLSRSSYTRATQSERNRHLIFHVSPQCVKSSRGQAEEQKSHIRELDRIYRADGRANETAEETELRRSENRLRIIARRNNMSAEETQQRHSDDRLRANARRNSMTTEERRSEDRLRRIARRNNITAEETEQPKRKITRRNNMTAEETQQ